MLKPFKGTYRLTQKWGGNYEMYKRFGLKGHNGTDWGTPNGTPILAPHSGKVLERAYDKEGYGNYIKIENDKFGSILGHLKRFDVKVGDTVKEGQQIGLSNNTGFSTGPHLHWGLYPKPRNRGNGYSGTVDPFKYLQGETMECLVPNTEEWRKKWDEIIRKSSLYDEFTKAGYGSAIEVKQLEADLRKSIKDKNEAISSEQEKSKRLREDYKELMVMVATALGTVQEVPQIKVKLDEIEKELESYDDLQRSYAEMEIESGKQIENLNAEIVRLKALLAQKSPLRHSTEIELIKELISRLTDLLKRSK